MLNQNLFLTINLTLCLSWVSCDNAADNHIEQSSAADQDIAGYVTYSDSASFTFLCQLSNGHYKNYKIQSITPRTTTRYNASAYSVVTIAQPNDIIVPSGNDPFQVAAITYKLEQASAPIPYVADDSLSDQFASRTTACQMARKDVLEPMLKECANRIAALKATCEEQYYGRFIPQNRFCLQETYGLRNPHLAYCRDTNNAQRCAAQPDKPRDAMGWPQRP